MWSMAKGDAAILEALATIWLRGTAGTASGSEACDGSVVRLRTRERRVFTSREIVYLWRLNGGIP
jgi:hypothetical protein